MKKMALIILFLALLTIESPRLCQAQVNPSFDCDQARSAVEIVICSNQGLAAMDATMAQKYQKLRRDSSLDQNTLLNSQRQWVKKRQEMCQASQNVVNCLERLYQQRLEQLAELSAPDQNNRLNPLGEYAGTNKQVSATLKVTCDQANCQAEYETATHENDYVCDFVGQIPLEEFKTRLTNQAQVPFKATLNPPETINSEIISEIIMNVSFYNGYAIVDNIGTKQEPDIFDVHLPLFCGAIGRLNVGDKLFKER
jgi:uncharacterized protein